MQLTVPSRGDRAGAVNSNNAKAALLAVLASWTAVIAAASWKHGLPFVPAPALVPPVITALLVALWTVPGLREVRRVIPLRWLILVHVTRFVGFYFLMLAGRGELSPTFALAAAYGDIAIASGAVLIAAFCLPPNTAPRRGVIRLWNALGLADMLFVVGTAAYLTRTAPASMLALSRLPLVLLPALVVPLVIVSHVVLYARLGRLDD
jgi:hypothetical protein